MSFFSPFSFDTLFHRTVTILLYKSEKIREKVGVKHTGEAH